MAQNIKLRVVHYADMYITMVETSSHIMYQQTYLTIPENSNISARMYERYPIVKTTIGSNTAEKYIHYKHTSGIRALESTHTLHAYMYIHRTY